MLRSWDGCTWLHHILFLLQVPLLLPAVYPKFLLRLSQGSLKVYLEKFPAEKWTRDFSPTQLGNAPWFYFASAMVHIVACDSQRHSIVFPWSKKYSEPWEDFLFLSFPQLQTINVNNYILNSFRSWTVYQSGLTIIGKSCRTLLHLEKRLINWNAPFCDFNFGKAFSKASRMHSLMYYRLFYYETFFP